MHPGKCLEEKKKRRTVEEEEDAKTNEEFSTLLHTSFAPIMQKEIEAERETDRER